MHIKYCEPCQFNKLKTIEKCPHELHHVKVPSKAWLQIGECYFIVSTIYCLAWGICANQLGICMTNQLNSHNSGHKSILLMRSNLN